jgi:hypothetical protein
MAAVKTDLLTQDNLRVYNLDPKATEVIAVAGPDGHDPARLDVDDLPEGFRRLGVDEWEELHNQT